MQELRLTAIRGNASEIRTLSLLSERDGGEGLQSFVDAEESQVMQKTNLERCLEDAERLSGKTGAIVVVSGIEDLVVRGERHRVFQGGSALSARITGSGCMLSELIGTCLTQPFPEWDAVCTAVEWMNQAAERAEERTREIQGGTMTYRMYLIDEISRYVIA